MDLGPLFLAGTFGVALACWTTESVSTRVLGTTALALQAHATGVFWIANTFATCGIVETVGTLVFAWAFLQEPSGRRAIALSASTCLALLFFALGSNTVGSEIYSTLAWPICIMGWTRLACVAWEGFAPIGGARIIGYNRRWDLLPNNLGDYDDLDKKGDKRPSRAFRGGGRGDKRAHHPPIR